jgi:peptidyl-prolyl cis-trans isomerase C
MRFTLFLTSFLTATGVIAWAQAPAADPVVITVGSEKITKSMFENIIGTLNDQQKQQLQTPEAKRALAEQIAELTMMAQEGRKRGLDQTPAIQTKIVLQAQQVLATAAYQEMTKNPPSDADVQAFYKEHEKEWTEAKGRHILVRFTGSRVPAREGQKDLSDDEALAKAKDLRAKIVGGAKFEDIAKAESDDVGSGENGGDLGSFGPGQMVEEFDKIAFELPVGQISEPVKTAFGYHLILIESRGAKNLEEVKPQIEQALRPQIGQKAVEELKSKTAITYDDAFFGKPEAPAAEAAKN